MPLVPLFSVPDLRFSHPSTTAFALTVVLLSLLTAACGDSSEENTQEDNASFTQINADTNGLAFGSEESIIIELNIGAEPVCENIQADTCQITRLTLKTNSLIDGQLLRFEDNTFDFDDDLDCNNSIPFIVTEGEVRIISANADKIRLDFDVTGFNDFDDPANAQPQGTRSIHAAWCTDPSPHIQ